MAETKDEMTQIKIFLCLCCTRQQPPANSHYLKLIKIKLSLKFYFWVTLAKFLVLNGHIWLLATVLAEDRIFPSSKRILLYSTDMDLYKIKLPSKYFIIYWLEEMLFLCSTETPNSIKSLKYLFRNFSMCGTKPGPANFQRGRKLEACLSRTSQISMQSKAVQSKTS